MVARAPANHRCVVPGKVAEILPALNILSAANQDQAVGLTAADIIGEEIGRGILKRNSQAIAMVRSGGCDTAKQREIEGVDIGLILTITAQNNERDSFGLLGTQAHRVVVDGVIQLTCDIEDLLPRFFVNTFLTTKRSRDSRLRNSSNNSNLMCGDPTGFDHAVMTSSSMPPSHPRIRSRIRSRAECFDWIYPIKPKAFGNGFAGHMAFMNVEAIEQPLIRADRIKAVVGEC
jgi:hypothetical protein